MLASTGVRPCRTCGSTAALTPERVHAQVVDQLRYEGDLATEVVRDARLLVCGGCSRLATHTCLDCGCYVEFRASLRTKRCPRGLWTV
ncbi:MAG TPA: DUF6171 family protein [Microlunatus sp.]|jgi:hypothetical protein|nr:DUF6171 family protein [Microlunatus sp.]